MSQGFANFLFPDALAFSCTYQPQDGTSFATRAVLAYDGFAVGSEAGKGLNRAITQTQAEFKHFRVPAADFPSPPKVHDSLTDDNGDIWRVSDRQPSRAGTYLLVCKANTSYRGPAAGKDRL